MSATGHVIGVVGNPNCGKTTLFNGLTGAKQQIGNWPGVTVEKLTGAYQHQGVAIEVVDLPGIYSIDIHPDETALDERIARDFILSHQADLIVNILDASNIQRNLYLTTELLEMHVPVLVVLNMMDVAKSRGIAIDIPKLERRLGCPVFPIVAKHGKGIPEMKSAINRAVDEGRISTLSLPYPEAVERALWELSPLIEDSRRARGRADTPRPMAGDSPTTDDESARRHRWLALKLIEGDPIVVEMAGGAAATAAVRLTTTIEKQTGEEADILIADSRYGFINDLTGRVLTRADEVRRQVSEHIDHVVLNRILGIPIFLAVMYLMFLFTINLGGAFIDFFDQFAGALFVEGLGAWMGSVGSPDWLTTLVAKGIGSGIRVVATFIPIIGFLYLFLSVLEDSGYMARAAFVMDRLMRTMGLPGKAFVPMIVGFGCNVPAIMATRTLENPRDRALTILMTPFMSCGARLPVYALFGAAFFPVGGQNLVFGLYLIGIAVAVFTGLIIKHTLLPVEASYFVMELPRYHLPALKSVLLHTWDRLKNFLFRAGKIIVPMVMIINLMNAIGTDGSFHNEDTDNSVLSQVGRALTPAFAPMGITQDNWPATVGVLTGVMAKEVVVGTLDAIYGGLSETDGPAGPAEQAPSEDFRLWADIRAAFGTLPTNLAGLLENVTDPLGIHIGDLSDAQRAASEQAVALGTFGAMATRFDGKAGAFAYLLFILMYFPCAAATAAIHRETSLGWAGFVGAWTTGLGYGAATLFYQAATFSEHPMASASWLLAITGLFGLLVLGLRRFGSVKWGV
uniref:Ferrous iron transport protein B n=1 Tax=Candidatus Kentrum eta TaxID=2126337 RepID=A0A450UAG3_9GAMM|nr:MAG: ferrous iron transport protein B [Candidatus Kentron sp. H]VFJ89107.1 MAG: ferrous iron transport protein B [Candidatus Kentron sp. H]VFJ95795.1 MAG: ferrous iron transport protein B [Candidatus Kentron sp. H]